MASKFLNSATTLALGMAFIVTPALLDTATPLSIDKVFAAQGGNGGGNGGGGSKSEKSSAAKAEKTEKISNGSIASQLGALNAAHASAQAFAHPSPNSRIGKIKAYYLANQIAEATDATVLQAEFDLSASIVGAAVVDAYLDLQADPTLQAAYDQAVLDAQLTPEQVATFEASYTTWQNALADDAEAAAALEAAANKNPVSPDAKVALDILLEGKIN